LRHRYQLIPLGACWHIASGIVYAITYPIRKGVNLGL
jgi:hypothetical protein